MTADPPAQPLVGKLKKHSQGSTRAGWASFPQPVCLGTPQTSRRFVRALVPSCCVTLDNVLCLSVPAAGQYKDNQRQKALCKQQLQPFLISPQRSSSPSDPYPLHSGHCRSYPTPWEPAISAESSEDRTWQWPLLWEQGSLL